MAELGVETVGAHALTTSGFDDVIIDQRRSILPMRCGGQISSRLALSRGTYRPRPELALRSSARGRVCLSTDETPNEQFPGTMRNQT